MFSKMKLERKEKVVAYLKKVGIGGIIFFTVKGCISLYVILTLGKCAIG